MKWLKRLYLKFKFKKRVNKTGNFQNEKWIPDDLCNAHYDCGDKD